VKRRHFLITIAVLFLVTLLLGAFKSNLPVVQYLGNTTGVLLGFVLGIWWQEIERERIHREQEAEKNQIQQAKVARFWNEYIAFLLELEQKVSRLKKQASGSMKIYDTIIELRLPLPEAKHFERQVSELDLDKKTRQEIEKIADTIQLLDEYMDFGAEKLCYWQTNFSSHIDIFDSQIFELNKKYSSKTAA
jgi:hypothetical protein